MIFGVLFLVQAHTARQVASREQTANGVIDAHESRNHDRYGYKFRVGQREYRGWEIPQKAEPSMGQSVTVYYDPLDPAKNALIDFAAAGDRLFGFGIGLLFLSTVVIGAVMFSSAFQPRRDSCLL